jgi:hypothetical protein
VTIVGAACYCVAAATAGSFTRVAVGTTLCPKGVAADPWLRAPWGGAQMELDKPERHCVLPAQAPEEHGRSGLTGTRARASSGSSKVRVSG